MPRVTFDGANKRIIVNNGTTSIDVQEDVYSDWKEWFQTDTNSKYLSAVRTIGGDPTTGVKSVAPYFFLTNGWKLKPYEGNHTLTITGNLFVDDPETYGSNITIPTMGTFQVLVNMSTTSDAISISATTTLTEGDKTDIADKVGGTLSFVHGTGLWGSGIEYG